MRRVALLLLILLPLTASCGLRRGLFFDARYDQSGYVTELRYDHGFGASSRTFDWSPDHRQVTEYDRHGNECVWIKDLRGNWVVAYKDPGFRETPPPPPRKDLR